MIANNGKPRWFFYPEWVGLNAITVVIAAVIAWTLVLLIESIVGGTIQVGGQTHITEDYLLMKVLLPVIGVSTGLTQYVLLRRYLARLGWWVGATFLGWLLPYVIGTIFSAVITSGRDINTVWVILGLALIGASIGLPQWWVIRRQVPQAAWWILAYGASWGMIGLLNSQTTDPLPVLLAVATMPAIATGFVCWLLLDRLPSHELEAIAQVH